MTPDERSAWLQGLKVGDAVVVWECAPKADAHHQAHVWLASHGFLYVVFGDARERTLRIRRSTGEVVPKRTASWQTRYTLEPMPKG